MFLCSFMAICVLSVSCNNIDYPSQSLEDPIVYYDDDTSQDSADLYMRHNYHFNNTSTTASSTAADQSDPSDITTEKPTSREKSSIITRTHTVLGHYPRKIKLIKNNKHEPVKYQENRNSEESSEEDLQTIVNYPYVASISRRGSHYATAALVDKRWVISVASEFFNVRESIKQFSVLLGSVNCKKGNTIPLKKIEIHPSFKPGRPSYDVSLLRMAWPVQFSSIIKPIPLSTVDSQVSSAKYLTTYWPRIIINDSILPQNAPERKHYNSLRVSTQSLIPLSKCAELMKRTNETLDQSLLCLNPVVEFHTKCMPDSGAPVVAGDALWGVTSGWSPVSCATTARRTPTLFTRVGLYNIRLWIDTVVLL